MWEKIPGFGSRACAVLPGVLTHLHHRRRQQPPNQTRFQMQQLHFLLLLRSLAMLPIGYSVARIAAGPSRTSLSGEISCRLCHE